MCLTCVSYLSVIPVCVLPVSLTCVCLTCQSYLCASYLSVIPVCLTCQSYLCVSYLSVIPVCVLPVRYGEGEHVAHRGQGSTVFEPLDVAARIAVGVASDVGHAVDSLPQGVGRGGGVKGRRVGRNWKRQPISKSMHITAGQGRNTNTHMAM